MGELFSDPVARSILVVLAFGAAAYLFSRAGAMIGRVLALAAGAWVVLFGVLMAGDVPADYDRLLALPLAPGVALNVQFSATFLGSLVVIGAGAFTLLIAVYSFRYMAGEYWEGKYYAYLIWTLAGACLVGWAGSFFVLLVGWELVTLSLFLMLNQGKSGCERGAAKTYGMLGFADACLLLAVGLMFALPAGAGQQLHQLGLRADAAPLRLGTLAAGGAGWIGYAIYALLIVAALAKAGAIPLHSWIPAAAADAPAPVMAYLPAAVDKLLGIYLLARVALDVFRPDWTFQVILMIVGAVTILAAVFMAMMQHNLKKLLAFHAVSQVGYMVLGIATGTAVGIIGGLFHMLNNAIYKSTLFLMSGAVGRAAGTDEIEDMGGLARRLPVTFVCGAIAALAISGVPPFNGFVSKWMVYQGALNIRSHGLGMVVLVAAVFGSALTLASFVKVIYSAFLGRPPVGAPRPGGAEGENFWMAAPMVVLAAACVTLGLYPQLIVNTALVPAVQAAGLDAAGALASSGGRMTTAGEVGLWGPSVATGLVLIGVGGGLALLGVFALKRVRVVRPFVAGEIFIGDDRVRVPGTGFYETIRQMPLLGALMKHGERGAMDLYRWLGRYGGGVVGVLRSQHTGLVSLYVAWCVVGLAVTLIYLLITGNIRP